jgi:hypothetical protein
MFMILLHTKLLHWLTFYHHQTETFFEASMLFYIEQKSIFEKLYIF